MAKGYQLLVMAQVLLIELHQVPWLFLKFSKGLSFVLVCGCIMEQLPKLEIW